MENIQFQSIKMIAKKELKSKVLSNWLEKDIKSFNPIDNKMQVNICNIY